jgi:hypothetical protein
MILPVQQSPCQGCGLVKSLTYRLAYRLRNDIVRVADTAAKSIVSTLSEEFGMTPHSG